MGKVGELVFGFRVFSEIEWNIVSSFYERPTPKLESKLIIGARSQLFKRIFDGYLPKCIVFAARRTCQG